MFFANSIFENVIFLLFSRIYDVIKIIVMTYFLLNCVFENDIFLRIRNVINNCNVMFLLIAYLKMTYFCGFVMS